LSGSCPTHPGSAHEDRRPSVHQVPDRPAAAERFAAFLSPADRLAIVTFDDEVDVVFGPALGGDPAALDAIARVVAGGSTNLSGGWLQGRPRCHRSPGGGAAPPSRRGPRWGGARYDAGGHPDRRSVQRAGPLPPPPAGPADPDRLGGQVSGPGGAGRHRVTLLLDVGGSSARGILPAEPQPAQRRGLAGPGARDRRGVSRPDGRAMQVGRGDEAGEPAMPSSAVCGGAPIRCLTELLSQHRLWDSPF